MLQKRRTDKKDNRAENMFIGLELADESVSRGFRDPQIKHMAERLITPVPGVSVRRGDKVPIAVVDRAQEIYDPNEKAVDALFDAYVSHLEEAEVLDVITTRQMANRLKSYAPERLSAMRRHDLRFLGVQYSSWVMDHFKIKDSACKGRIDAEFKRTYQKRTENLEASIATFKDVHGDTGRVQDLCYRMDMAQGLAKTSHYSRRS